MATNPQGNWENFCEQKFSQTLSKNFNFVTRRGRRVTKMFLALFVNKSFPSFLLPSFPFSLLLPPPPLIFHVI